MTAPVTDTSLVPPRTTTTPEGAAVTVRRAVPDDLDAVARLHRRCSLETIFRRYFTGVPQMSPALQRRLLQTRLALVLSLIHI